jgi:uncharacterized protein YjiS (DUF1127 family)
MAYLLSSERPAVAAAQSNPIRSLFAWIAKANAARARRRALVSLLEFDDAMLDDIGIRRSDLFDAMHSPRAGQTLAQRRAAAARHWLDR